MRSFLRRLSTSKCGYFLVAVQVVLAVVALADKPVVMEAPTITINFNVHPRPPVMYVAGRLLHYSEYGHGLDKAVIYMNLPAIIMSIPLAIIGSYFIAGFSDYARSWFTASYLLLTMALQWQCIGCLIEKWWVTRRAHSGAT